MLLSSLYYPQMFIPFLRTSHKLNKLQQQWCCTPNECSVYFYIFKMKYWICFYFSSNAVFVLFWCVQLEMRMSCSLHRFIYRWWINDDDEHVALIRRQRKSQSTLNLHSHELIIKYYYYYIFKSLGKREILFANVLRFLMSYITILAKVK